MIVAVVGMCGSGKSTFVEIVKEKYSVNLISFGNIVRNMMRDSNLEITPVNEKKMRSDIRTKYGTLYLAERVIGEICQKNQEDFILDGVYSLEEYVLLKNKLPNIVFVALVADKSCRYERLKNRKVRPFSQKEVEERDMDEVVSINKGGPIALADYFIVNNGDMQYLIFQIESIISKILQYEG